MASRFREAGFGNAIIAKDAPSEKEDGTWDPEDARYSAIRWVPGQNAMGWGRADPRSGEVISAHATFWHSMLNELENLYFAQVAPLDVRAQRLPLPDEVMGQLLRCVVSPGGPRLGAETQLQAHSAYLWRSFAAGVDRALGAPPPPMSSPFNYVARPA